MAALNQTLSKLLPQLYSIPRPIVTPEVPVIVAGSMLTIYDAPMLPVIKTGTLPKGEKEGVKLSMAIGGLPMVTMLLETEPQDYYKMLWKPCTSTGIMIGTLGYDETLERLLQIFETTKFGDAKVEAPRPPHALVTLTDVISLYKQGKLRCSMTAGEVASRSVAVEKDVTLAEAMRLMCDQRIRRLFLEGRRGEFISDRAILNKLFSPRGLKVARDSPEDWIDLTVSDIQPMTGFPASPEALVEDLGNTVEPGRDVFFLSERESIVSRWDLVMKPWKAGKLRLAA